MLAVHCSTIIEHVQKVCSDHKGQMSFCLYYYFDFKDRRRQTLDGFIRSALAQFCLQNAVIPQELMDLYEAKNRKGQDPSSAKLVETLLTFLKQPGKAYIILDALDECGEQKEILHLISKIQGAFGCSVNILVTSRMEKQIQTDIENLATRVICLQGPCVYRDIQTFVNRVLVRDPVLGKRPVRTRKEIEQALVNGAGGMYVCFPRVSNGWLIRDHY